MRTGVSMKRFVNGYWKHMAIVGVLVAVFFAARSGQITRDEPNRISRRPVPVRIDEPLVLIRGERCLLTETKVACGKRVP
jgi:hypothetical protein